MLRFAFSIFLGAFSEIFMLTSREWDPKTTKTKTIIDFKGPGTPDGSHICYFPELVFIE